MLKEGIEMTAGTASVQDEIKEVEQELQEKDFTSPPSPTATTIAASQHAEALEAGTSWKPRRRHSISEHASSGIVNLLNLLFSPVFVQTFIMTFLGEWGDRSQIATITLAAASGSYLQLCWLTIDFWYVTMGTIIAHGGCTALAVIGGRLLASKISVRNGLHLAQQKIIVVTLGGAILFLAFGVIYTYEGLFLEE